MGKGGALNAWIKEFTALVFTQTVQAFIYAIIISIILFGMSGTKATGVSANDNNSALGLMATFALLSVFKVEEMVKKIFGLSETKASHGNAMKSIAKTAIAAKLGKRVLDNAGKITGGIGSIARSGQDRKKTMKRFEEDMSDNGFVKGKDGKLAYAGKGAQRGNDTLFSNQGGGSGGASGSAEQAIENMAKSAGASAGGISSGDRAKMRNAFRSYEDKLSEINKQRREGIKSIASGLAEGTGAVFGATTGGILGGADGNIDEMLQGIMAGAGIGDAAGQGIVNTVDKALQFAQRNYKRESGMSNKQAQKIIDSYKTAYSTAASNHKKVDYID